MKARRVFDVTRRFPHSTGLRAAWIALCTLILSAPAFAHDRTNSYSVWIINGTEANVTTQLWEIDTTRFDWGMAPRAERDSRTAAYLAEHLQLLAGDQPCRISRPPRPVHAPHGRLAFEWGLSCPRAAPLAIRSTVLLDVAPAHLHFARLRQDGGVEHERVLSSRAPQWSLNEVSDSAVQGETASTGLSGYIRLGVEHILSGYDHLTFVLALLLIGGTLSEVAKVVTGFTVAHSLTLALAALGYVHPAPAPIEALIGASIALVAAENIWLVSTRTWTLPAVMATLLLLLAGAAASGRGSIPPLTLCGLALFVACYFGLLRRVRRQTSLRWGIAFLFGLVHGFGFAAVLGETGLPANRVAIGLFGFNVGVEIGQLLVVCIVWPILYRLTRGNLTRRQWLIEVGSAAIAALGVFWFVSRGFAS